MQSEMMIADTHRPHSAALMMITGMFVIGFTDNFVSVVSDTIGLWQFHLIRSALMLPMIWTMSQLGWGKFWPKRWGPVLARSLMLATSMMLYFGALGFLSIAQAVAGLFTSPIFILLIHVLFMGQRVGPWRISAVLLGFAGVLMVLQPAAEGASLWLLMPVAGGLFYAVSAIGTRSWCEGESTLALLAGGMAMLGIMGGLALIVIELLGLESATGAAGFMTRGWVWPIWDISHWMILMAVGAIAGVFFLIRAYQMEDPGFVSVFEYSLMIFGPMFGWLLFGQPVEPWQMVGIAMITVSGLIIAVRSER